jgi:glycosyltransferase involved in cell wall biosynthesis
MTSPDDVQQFAAEMKRLLLGETIRAGLREKGLARAREFSWLKASGELLMLFGKIAGSV